MSLLAGDETATHGMAKSIYDKMDDVMKGDIPPDSLEDVRKGWRKLSYAVAKGVIEHIKENMEVFGVQTQGNVSAAVTGSTAVQNNVIFTQSNDGTGLVQ